MPKIRVYELAKELGVDSKTLMTKLNELGEFVRSPSSPIEPSTVRRLRASFGASGLAVGRATGTPVKQVTGRGMRSSVGGAREARQQALPRPTEHQAPGWAGKRPRKSHQKRIAPEQQVVLEALFGESNVRAVLTPEAEGYSWEWQHRIISRETFVEFTDMGLLSVHEAALAEDCLHAGLDAVDLQVRLGDRTVLEWIRKGYSPAQVSKTLQECRADPDGRGLSDDPRFTAPPADH